MQVIAKIFRSNPVGVLTLTLAWTALSYAQAPAEVLSFEQCVKAGGHILKTFPAQCQSLDGKVFRQALPPGAIPVCRNMCGNGECEEIVCQAVGCPCSENAESCPQDCAAK